MSNENEETVEIYIQENMDLSERTELVAKLKYEKGIVSAWFDATNHHRFVVSYDRKYFSNITLLDLIKEHGSHGELLSASAE